MSNYEYTYKVTAVEHVAGRYVATVIYTPDDSNLAEVTKVVPVPLQKVARTEVRALVGRKAVAHAPHDVWARSERILPTVNEAENLTEARGLIPTR